MKYTFNIDPRTKIEDIDKLDVPVGVQFTGDFTEESAAKFRSELNVAEYAARLSGQDIIPITIDSYGGDVYALMSCLDAVDACSLPVATIVEGKAMSAGAFLFAYGKQGHRYVAPGATLMYHSAQYFAYGKHEEIKNSAKAIEFLQKRMFERVSKRIGKPLDWLDQKLMEQRHLDWYLSPEEAVELGFANHIGVPVMNVEIKMTHSFALPPTK